MFGYVRAYKPELKFKDYDVYRGVYCSVCKQLLHSYGPAAQLALSYDVTFFALFIMAFGEDNPQFTECRCCYNPAKKCHKCSCDGGAVEMSSDIAMILMYYKVRDNIEDSGFFKRTGMRLLLPVISRIHKKAAGKQPEAEKIVAAAMAKQAIIEKKSESSADEAAHPSADAMGKLLKLAVNGNEDVYRLGYLLGRWVYLIDATEDIGDDIRLNSFNPFKNRMNKPDDFKEYMREILNVTVTEMIKTYEQLKPVRYDDILTNIIYIGLSASENNVLSGERRRKHEKSV